MVIIDHSEGYLPLQMEANGDVMEISCAVWETKCAMMKTGCAITETQRALIQTGRARAEIIPILIMWSARRLTMFPAQTVSSLRGDLQQSAWRPPRKAGVCECAIGFC